MFNGLNLDTDEQIRRMDVLVREALDAFAMPNAKAELAAYTNNGVYHVVDPGARYVKEAHYALRVHRPGLKKREWIESELLWLTDIRRYTTLNVPEPAAPVYTGMLDSIEQPVYCTLFGWMKGQAANDPVELTPQRLHRVGQFIAQLHQHSLNYEPPEGFTRPRLDVDSLFADAAADGTPSPYASAGEAAYFTDEQRHIIAAVQAQVTAAITQLDRDSFGLIHGDLILKNILFIADDEIGAIDFDDCAFGYYLYDLVPLLWRCKDEPNYTQIRNTLWDGYTSVLLQPEAYGHDILEALLAARHVASCRWIAGNADHPDIRGKAQDIISRRMYELEQFLSKGRIAT